MSAGTKPLFLPVHVAPPDFQFPPPPDFPPPPPPLPAISRYRSLRGKSVSSPGLPKVLDCYFDQCNADCGGANHNVSSDLPLRDAASSAPTSLRSIRRRSKSVSNTPARLLLIPSPTGRVAPKPAWRAIGSLGAPRSSSSSSPSQLQGPARHAPATPTTPPVIIAHDGGHQGSDVPDLTALPPFPVPPFPTALSFKSRNIPSSPKTASIGDNYNYNSAQSPAKPDISRLKALNDFAFNHNSVISRRAVRLQRDEADRRQREETDAAHLADEVARLEAETDRILAEQKKRDAARAQVQLPLPPPRPKFLILEKFSFLSRSRRSNATSSQVGTPSPSPTAPTVFSLDSSRSSSLEDSTSQSPEKMSFIEQGGRGIVPQIDAPTSASNGGERRVTVRCLSSTISLPITPETSPVDILYSTANLTSHNIDPANSVLIECYTELGLERRLRRYERIRDVMNSWDRDQQNSLLVLTCDLSEDNSNLDITSVARTEQNPSGFSVQLYHSSRPGKWNKRWITLLENGQILASKKPDAGAHDKDSTILCHLSDFDIYTPRESEVRRHLKAPKRFCYAIKSQQKTFVFPNGENFVHFFCTEHRDMAKRFLETVHGWRSWYLVNKKVDLTKKDEKAMQQVKRAGTVKHGANKSISVAKSGGHRLKVSVDETPYTIGDFQPLLDLGRFDKPLEEFGKEFLEEKKAVPQPEPQPQPGPKQESTLQRRPTNRSKVLTKSQGQPPPLPQALQGEEEFSPAGLLGNRYEEKKRQHERPVQVAPKIEGPFTEGPSLLNGGVDSPISPVNRLDSRPWIPSAAEHSIQSRSRSVKAPRRPVPSDSGHSSRPRHPPQPLLNLANNFPEPPRAAWREGQGRGMKAPTSNGPLINFATGGAPQDFVMRNGNRTTMAFPGGPGPLISSAGPHGQRPRSRSSAALQPPSHRFEDAPPIPPLPHRSVRRQNTQPMERPRGRDPRPREPLINRAGTTGTMRF